MHVEEYLHSSETPQVTEKWLKLLFKRALTVSGQVVDEAGQEGDEHTGNDDVDNVEQRFAFDDQVEGDVLVLVAVHGDVLVDVSLGRPVDDLPLAVFCQH